MSCRFSFSTRMKKKNLLAWKRKSFFVATACDGENSKQLTDGWWKWEIWGNIDEKFLYEKSKCVRKINWKVIEKDGIFERIFVREDWPWKWFACELNLGAYVGFLWNI